MSDTKADEKLYSLKELGIRALPNEHGLFSLSIDFEDTRNDNGSTKTLTFDQKSRTWSLLAAEADDGFSTQIPDLHTGISPTVPATLPEWVDSLPDNEHITSFRSVDWNSTALGPLNLWSAQLQTLVSLVMNDNMAACTYWGSGLHAIYNSSFHQIVAGRLSKHRDYMGAPFSSIFPKVWIEFEPLLREIAVTNVSADALDVDLYPETDGMVQETFWTGSWVPIRNGSGQFQGFYNRGRETTKETVAGRRTKTLNSIASSPELDGDYVWEHIFKSFRENDRDFPLAFMYRASEEATADQCRLVLKQSIGVPEGGHTLVPKTTDLFAGQSGFFPYYKKAKSSDQPLLLHRSDGSLPDELVEGFDWQGFKEQPRSIAIIAISASNRLLGVLVIGLNPRSPYDKDYEGFLNSLNRTLSATIINAIDKEQGRIRAEYLTAQLLESEKQIRELALHSPDGMVRLDNSGRITWANDRFYELTGHSKREEDQYQWSFLDIVDPSDHEKAMANWPASPGRVPQTTISIRLRRRWRPPRSADGVEQDEEPVWVRSSSYKVVEQGEVKGVAATVTDISHYKWAEETQSRMATAAKEAKRLQEVFIDIVSHEMRNPLSAITQLADEIQSSIENLEGNENLSAVKSILDEHLESAKTILLCASHQKRLIDDVLTLSKLDAMMLSITPVPVQPSEVVKGVLNMFDGELKSNGIEYEATLHPTYAQNKLDWVYMDPSRLTQILINLLGNAIKFTRLEKTKKITIRSGATLTRPPGIDNVQWFPTDKKYRDLTAGEEWGTGDQVFVVFEVQDTGRGIEQSEMDKLFERFQQATAKTHIKYGGSGLGLFISRELTETQGGEIGVTSQPGHGCTFAFYIKARKAVKPADQSDRAALPSTRSPHESSSTPLSKVKPIAGDRSIQGTYAQQKKACVLLVEDNIVNAKILSRQLEKHGNLEVHLANHGQEALEFLTKTKSWKSIDSNDAIHALDIEFILMDVEMPVMDGLTCTTRIRQLEQDGTLTKHMNIIAITANARQEQIDNVMRAGVDDVMSKPFKVQELIDKLGRLGGKANNG